MMGNNKLSFAAIVATTKDRKSLIVVQRTIGSEDWGLPCGGIETGEEPLVAALREYEEETGLLTSDLMSLELSTIMRSNPHKSDSKLGQTFLFEYQGSSTGFPYIGPEGLKVDIMEIDTYIDLCSYRSHDEMVLQEFGLIK